MLYDLGREVRTLREKKELASGEYEQIINCQYTSKAYHEYVHLVRKINALAPQCNASMLIKSSPCTNQSHQSRAPNNSRKSFPSPPSFQSNIALITQKVLCEQLHQSRE